MSRDELGDKPLAVLIAKGEFPRVWTITEPPPPVLLVPRHVLLSVKIDDPPSLRPHDHRVFRLSLTMRSATHRWMRVYHDGRSQTPEDAYVYVEE